LTQRALAGLKPIDFIGFIGTTEVVPCYKALKPSSSKTQGAVNSSSAQTATFPHFPEDINAYASLAASSGNL
jgi:hypothetical protein